MTGSRAALLQQLKKEIFPLQGLKHSPAAAALNFGLGPIEAAFPNGCFPVGAVHEFITGSATDAAATGGFVAALLGQIMQTNGAALWISCSRKLFPPALTRFGADPHRVIFVDVKNEQQVCWALEEALKCNGLAAVIGEIPEISFTATRRLQLAVEESRVTGFLLRNQPKNLSTSACVSRWRITSVPSHLEQGMPGVGYPRWSVELLKIRNGKPGMWELEWSGNRFNVIMPLEAVHSEFMQQTG